MPWAFQQCISSVVAKDRVKKMALDKVHLRHCMLYEFQKRSNTSVACKNLWDTFRSKVENVRTCQRWFAKFCSRDLSLTEDSQSGRPSKVDNNILQPMLESNPHLMTRAIAKELVIPVSTIRQLRNISKILDLS